MANLGFSLRATFGLIPATDKLEAAKNALTDEYKKLQEFAESDELKAFIELQQQVESESFKNKKAEVLALDYKQTEAFQKEQKYLKLQKDKGIVNYFKTMESNEYKRFQTILDSENLAQFQELEQYLASSEHQQIVANLKSQLGEEQNKLKQYTQLKKSSKFKTFYKTKQSPKLSLYNELHDSEALAEYQELEAFVTSDQLKSFKQSVLEQLNAEKAKKKTLSQLLKSPEVKNYQKLKDKEDVEKPTAMVEYETLATYLNSEEYQQKLTELQYKNTNEAEKEARFYQLKKDAKFKTYFKFLNSKELTDFLALNDSEELKEYEALEAYVTSEEYQLALQKYTYTKTDEFAKEQTFNQLKNSDDIKFWGKYGKSKPYLLFTQVENSDLLKEYEALDEEIKSEDFITYKNYMLDKDKWSKTNEAQVEAKYLEMKNSENITWYYKVKDSNKFDALKVWNLTFEDDFNQGKVDEDVWMNSFFWGKMLLNDRYVLAGDKQYYTDNKNLELNGTSVKIVTKNERAIGKVWSDKIGFINQEFDYTSGMLSSAHSFRQQYGKVEAKVKLSDSYPVYQAFWLKGEKILPEIDVFKFNMDKKNKMQMANFWGDPMESKKSQKAAAKVNASSLTKDFHIYSLEWTPEKITWKINDIEVYSSTQGIPAEPLYLIFSSGITKENAPENLPGTMEIDWVRCYEKA